MNEEEFEAMQAALIQQMEAQGDEFVIPDEDRGIIDGFLAAF
jgi:hypothetical protein